MAEANSTLTCQECENPFVRSASRGKIPTYCGSTCRARAQQRAWRSRSAQRPPCKIPDCSNPKGTKGYCSKHYARFKAHGDPLYTKRHLRVSKPCGWCGESMSLKPGQMDKRQCCSHTCANYLKASNAGMSIRSKGIWCAGCHNFSVRTVRTEKDAGKHCSRECAAKLRLHISRERAALRRIGYRKRAAKRDQYSALVTDEVRALRRIAKRCSDPAKNIACSHCGTETRRKRKFFMYCSLECKRESQREKRQAYKQSEKFKAYKQSENYKANRRASKSRRRALLRTATADSIDPFKVFERDQWKCHLCGDKTLKSKRGTIHDRAPELEHIISLAEGGTHTWGNVACSCRKCNGLKGSSSAGQLGFQLAC